MSKQTHPFLISTQTYRQMLEDVVDKKAELVIKLGALDEKDPVRLKAEGVLKIIGPQIGSIKALFDSKLALFQRIHVFELTSGVSEATKAELDKVKNRTDEVEQEKKLQELEKIRDMMNSMEAHLEGHSRPVSPATTVESVSTFRAASISSEDYFTASSTPFVSLAPKHTSSSYVDNDDSEMPSANYLAFAEAPYIPQPIADLSRFNNPNYRPSLSSDGVHPNVVEDEYSATMFIAHHRTFSSTSAPPKRVDTPEPALSSLPVPPRRKPSLNPALKFATDSHPLATAEALPLREEESSESAFVRGSSRDAQDPRGDSTGTKIDNVYERSDTGGFDTLSYVDFSEVSSDGHGTHSRNLSIHTDAFGTHN